MPPLAYTRLYLSLLMTPYEVESLRSSTGIVLVVG
jgi:hypothetical protein